jgi:sugar transferase (PEP-CTERM/EpsH1 system associated)
MASLLFLCHRMPWPPDKGDKIRAHHVLRRLAEHHDVYLGTCVDDPDDWRHLASVEALCAGVCVRPLPAWRMRMRALAAWGRGDPLTLGAYRDRVLQRWVDGLVANRTIDTAVCFSSGVAPLVMRHAQLRRVMDFVDVDSDKWRQYADAHTGLKRAIYRREARRLAAFERAVAESFDASLLVSASEAAFFRRAVPAAANRVHGIANGVDAKHWHPQGIHANPYALGERTLVFVGAMDYRANVDAVAWFVREVWPAITARQPLARFYIVGSKPAAAVRALAAVEGVRVTGRVEDVRPYVAHAHAVVAPLRIARGIQNKVLEALAMEKVVLATPQAWEGIDDFAGRQGCIDASPGVLAAEALRWLGQREPAAVPAARLLVESRFDWSRNLDAYEGVVCGTRDAAAVAHAVHLRRPEACL